MKIFFLLALSLPSLAAYSFHGSIAVDHTKCGSSTSSNFPVAVILTDATFKVVGSGGDVQNTVTQTGGNAVTMPADLIFTSDSGGSTKIPWEFESYVTTTGAIVAHVLASCNNSTDTVFYIHWGDVAVTTQQNTGSYSVDNVWSAGSHVGVWHVPDGSSLLLNDSTSNALNLTNTNGSTATTGQVDGGVNFNYASQQSLNAGTSTTLDPAAITVSAWINAANFILPFNSITERASTAFNNGDYTMLVKDTGKLAVYVADTGGTVSSYDGTGSHTLSTGTWYYLTFTYAASGSLIGYVNGAVDDSVAATALGLNGGASKTFVIGSTIDFFPRNFSGSMDEVRVSSVARSADWILAEYNNQSSPGTFLTFTTPLPSSGTIRHRVIQ